MEKTEITKLRKQFWKENFKKYTTEPNENGFDWDIGSMLDDFAELVVKNNTALSDVSTRFSPKEITNILRKPKLALISPDLKNILSVANDYDYDKVEDVEFIAEYAGKKAIVYEWCGDWWIAEDDNYPITEKCFEFVG